MQAPSWAGFTKLTHPDLHHVVGLLILRDVCPSILHPVSALKHLQFWLDPFHIHTSYLATSEGVSRVTFLAKFQNFKFWQFFKIRDFDFILFWLGVWYESLVSGDIIAFFTHWSKNSCPNMKQFVGRVHKDLTHVDSSKKKFSLRPVVCQPQVETLALAGWVLILIVSSLPLSRGTPSCSCSCTFWVHHPDTIHPLLQRRGPASWQSLHVLLGQWQHGCLVGIVDKVIQPTCDCYKIWLFAILGHNGCTAAYSGASLVLCQYRKWVK